MSVIEPTNLRRCPTLVLASLCALLSVLGCGDEGSSSSPGVLLTPETANNGSQDPQCDAPTAPAIPSEPAAPAMPAAPDLSPVGGCPSGELSEEGGCLPEAPDPPTPLAWECPTGWSSVSVLELLEGAQANPLDETSRGALEPNRVCVPPPLPESCSPGEMMVVGQGCVRVGPGCPADGELFHTEATLRARTTQGIARPGDPPNPYQQGRVWYVWGDAVGEGLGTRGEPFWRVTDALEVAAAGDLIAVGPGAYVEELAVDKQVALVGACAEQTTLRAPDVNEERTIVRVVSVDGMWLSDVTLTGERPGVVVSFNSIGTAHLQGVVLEQTMGVGLDVLGRDVRVGRLVVNHTQPRISDRAMGYGIRARGGGWVEGEQVVLSRNHGAGLFVAEVGSRATLRDASILHTQPESDDLAGGHGVAVLEGGRLEGERLLLSHNHDIGLVVLDEGSEATVHDTSILHTHPRASDLVFGLGAVAGLGGHLDAERLLLSHNHDIGLAVLGDGSEATVKDTVILHTQPRQASQTAGWGVGVEEGGRLDAERLLLSHNHDIGLALRAGSRATVRDVAVFHTQPQQPGWGWGIRVLEGELEGARLLLSHNHNVGLIVVEEGARATVRDAAIVHTQPQPSNLTGGRGVTVVFGGVLEGERLLLSHNHALGLLIGEAGSSASLKDASIVDTQPQRSDRTGGRGVAVQSGGALEGERLLLSRNRDSGLFVSGAGSSAVVRDTSILHTQPQESDQALGAGLVVQEGGALEGERLLLSHNHTAGAHVSGGGSRATVRDALVLDTQPQQRDQTWGQGISVLYGAQLEGDRLLLARNHHGGLVVARDGAKATVKDTSVLDTQPQPADLGWGWGVTVMLRGELEGERLLLSRNHEVGLFVGEGRAMARLKDATIDDTQPNMQTSAGGRGITVQSGGELEGERLLLSHNREAGLDVSGVGSRAALRDAAVLHTQPRQVSRVLGLGLHVRLGGALEGERLLLSHNHDVGLLVVGEGSSASLEDASILHTQPQQLGLIGGRGGSVQSGGTLTAERLLLSHNHEVGLFVSAPGSTATLNDATILHTQPRPADRMGGSGVIVTDEATAALTRFEVAENALVGVLVARDATLDGEHGGIYGNFIGLNIQSESFEPDALDCVSIESNCCGDSCERFVCNVESQEPFIPDAADAIEPLRPPSSVP